jgi:hypothetical protein
LSRQSSEIAAHQSGQPTGGFSESFVMSLVDQFAMMQQQMFDQSQQAMTTMAEMLKARHESESELVWRELAHIRELSHELRDLGRELASSRTDSIRRLTNVPAQNRERLQTREEEQVAAAEAESVTSKIVDDTNEDELIAETSDSAAHTNQSQTNQIKIETDDKSIDETEPSELETEPSELAADTSPREDQPPTGNDDLDENPHAWLSQRMAAIDKERNSRWQKITRLLTGAASDDFHL